MTYNAIKTSVENNVLTLTMNRPDRLNAFNLEMRDEMIDVFTKVNSDDDVRAVIVTGEGRGFCAGADLGAGKTRSKQTSGPMVAGRASGAMAVVS